MELFALMQLGVRVGQAGTAGELGFGVRKASRGMWDVPREKRGSCRVKTELVWGKKFVNISYSDFPGF